ncbi:MAG: histidinol-phosphate transaminase [Oscillospiraceae bacterium]|nr:histidinol-phosphate transaminase [Candidatus Equicaccousia limihippi]
MSKYFSQKYAALTPYVPGEQPQNQKYIKLNTNESPFPPSPIAQRLARQAAGDLNLYSDPECRDLVKVAAEKSGVKENQILFTNGSDEILNFAFMAFCDGENPAVFPDITYGFYPVFAQLNGIPYQTIPLKDDFTVDVNDYIGINKNIFIANPNAPTGICLPLCDIEKIVSSNPDNIVVVDEAYIDFGGESAIGLIDKYDNLLVTRTFSKSRSLAGARLGFGAANEKLIQDLNTVKYSTNPYNINRCTMYAGIGVLFDTKYFEDNCKAIISTREKTAAALKQLGFYVTPSKTNFLFAKSDKIGGKELYLALKEKGVLVRHFDKEKLYDFNRITVGSDEEMQTFIQKVKQVLEEVK